MLIIKFFSSFGPSDGCIEAYTRVSELMLDPNFNTTYTFTTGENYTHAIILNTAMPALTLPKENVIGLAFEPLIFLNLTPAFIAYANKHIGKYLIGEKKNLPPPFIEHFGYMWHITPLHLSTIPNKSKVMSLMISNKVMTSGHQYRHTLCKRILNSNLPIDIYGNGCKIYEKSRDTRLKGIFQDNEPYEDYLFHIAIENVETPHYFSEKIMNPLLCNTTPIYLGCQEINQYFPNMVITLTGQIESDMTLLTDICQRQERYIKQSDVAAVKKTIHFANVVNLFTT
jgi:hypothetical protein